MNSTNPLAIEKNLRSELKEAEHKAWVALGGYKFQMFGYWCAIWVHINKIGGFKEPNPWKDLVKLAKNSPKAKLAAKKVGK